MQTVQILDNYYEPTPLTASSVEHKYGESDFSLNIDYQHLNLLPADQPNPAADSTQDYEPSSLPLHFYLQNLNYQRLNQSINTATKEKRKQKQQQ